MLLTSCSPNRPGTQPSDAQTPLRASQVSIGQSRHSAPTYYAAPPRMVKYMQNVYLLEPPCILEDAPGR
jgi:hypothetical protein